MKAAELEQQRYELQQRGSVMSERARADLQKAFDKGRIDFERFQQDAQAELQGMQRQFEAEFRLKLMPVVDQISKEKGLHFVFGLEQSTMIVWWNPSLDISDEIVKRLDADAKQVTRGTLFPSRIAIPSRVQSRQECNPDGAPATSRQNRRATAFAASPPA